MVESTGRILLVYATREGQTAKIAERLAELLRAKNREVDVIDAANSEQIAGVRLGDYGLLVFGASMHAGGLEREIVSLINQHKESLRGRPRSLFLVLLSAATQDPQLRAKWLADARQKMTAQLKVEFPDSEMLAGALRYSQYPLPQKWMMRRIARQAGVETDISQDYEYTNWEQVAGYAERLTRLSQS